MTLLINENSPTKNELIANLLTGGIAALPDFGKGDALVPVTLRTVARVNGAWADTWQAGDVLTIGIGDGIDAPVCVATITTALPSASVTATNVSYSAGPPATLATSTISFTAGTYGGLYSVTATANSVTTPCGNISPIATPSQFLALLQTNPQITASNCTVTQIGATFVVQWTGNLAGTSPTIAVTNVSLLAPVGASGALGINTSGIAALFAGTTANQLSLVFEVSRTRGSVVQNLYQETVTILRSVIDPNNIVPTPPLQIIPDFLVMQGTGLHVNIAEGITGGAEVAAQSAVAVADNSTNYVEVTSAGVAAVNQSSFNAANLQLAIVVTSGGAITGITDRRGWVTGGQAFGMTYPATGIPQSTGTAWGTSITPGTGVVAALGNATNAAGGLVTFSGSMGTPSSLVGTNITGTAASLTAGYVTTNANLTGPITSSGNTTSVASQTGTGSKFVMDTSPTITGLLCVKTTSANSLALQLFDTFDNNSIVFTPSYFTFNGGSTFNSTIAFASQSASNTITFPNTTGNVVTTGDSLTVTNAMLAGSIDLTAKVTGLLPGTHGGTGVNNGASTITIGANLKTTGSSATTLAFASGGGTYIFPNANDMIAGLATSQTLTNKTLLSPTFVTPALGTPASGILTNCTFPTLNQNTTGSAANLATGRTISITGDMAYTSPSFDGSGNVTAAGTLATSGVTAGTYGSATVSAIPTVDAKGRVTGVTTATITPAIGNVTASGSGGVFGNGSGGLTQDSAITTNGSGTMNVANLTTGGKTSNIAALNSAAVYVGDSLTAPVYSARLVANSLSFGGSALSGAATYTNTIQSGLSLAASYVSSLPNATGTLINTGNLSSITGTGALTSGSTQAGFTVSLGASTITGTLASANGGTGVSNAGTLTNASNTTITGGGTLALGGYTCTVPATDTVAMLGQANTFTGATNTFNNGITGNKYTSADSSTMYFQFRSSSNSDAVLAYGSQYWGFSASNGIYSYNGTWKWGLGNGATGTLNITDGTANNSSGKIACAGVTNSGATTLGGTLNANGAFVSTPQALNGAGAVNLTTLITELTATAPGHALTLANGTSGQFKIVKMVATSGGGTCVITPTTAAGYTTITISAVGQQAILVYSTTGGWSATGNSGVVIA